mmetsp:Transcript_23971/g.53982  ORF Transcript_23971/g.53982 Transcript_23971/m.53982 type:complete len:1025 (+) Transcript_23971:51-3125(+)
MVSKAARARAPTDHEQARPRAGTEHDQASSTRKAATASASTIKVCVRVRPFNQREKDLPEGLQSIVQMPSPTQVVVADDRNKPHPFEFDHAFWSLGERDDGDFASQETLMNELGKGILASATDGFNNCLFAYGQTGSGKTHSVLGSDEDKGLLPRILQGMFEHIHSHQVKVQLLNNRRASQASNRASTFSNSSRKDVAGAVTYICKVSYLEIYNENIRDLLIAPNAGTKKKLEVRHHPKLGPYVPNLTEETVSSYAAVQKLLDFGFASRSVASTVMNSSSSRSHCIFTFSLDKMEVVNGKKSHLCSRVNLVDLAGSERQQKTHAEGDRLKEGAMINQSLSALALIIQKLADNCEHKSGHGGAEHVPFRNSKLTHLLQESLSGNSKTVMIAAISPSKNNFEETLSTLRFAHACKSIQTKAVQNQESKEAIVEELKRQLAEMKKHSMHSPSPEALQQLQESEELRRSLEKSLKAQEEEAAQREAARAQALDDMGLSIDEIMGNFNMDKETPELLNISDDPSLSGCLVYFVVKGQDTTIGSDPDCTIVLQGLGIRQYMCKLYNADQEQVTLTMLKPSGEPMGRSATARRSSAVSKDAANLYKDRENQQPGRILVNGKAPDKHFREMRHMDRIILGHAFCFRLLVPMTSKRNGHQRTSIVEATQGGIEEALHEVMQDDSPEYKECHAMVDSLQDRIGTERVEVFLQEFGKALPLVEEGNLISQEVRCKDKLRFQIELCSDIMTFTTDEPEVIVRLYQEKENGMEEVIDVFELPQFAERLEYMREVYRDFQAEPGMDWASWYGEKGLDPWETYNYKDIMQKLQEVDHELEEQERASSQAQVEIEQLRRENAELKQRLQADEEEAELLRHDIADLQGRHVWTSTSSRDVAGIKGSPASRKNDSAASRRQQSEVLDILGKVAVRLGRTPNEIQQFAELLHQNWYTDLASLSGVTQRDLSDLGLPHRVVKELAEMGLLSGGSRSTQTPPSSPRSPIANGVHFKVKTKARSLTPRRAIGAHRPRLGWRPPGSL